MSAMPEPDTGVMAERVVYLVVPGGGPAMGHTAATRADLARRLAGLLGFRYGGEHLHADAPASGARSYYVPTDTLGVEQARQLGIGSEADLFGGVVPHPFLATKTISHALVRPDARAPEGWVHDVAGWMGGSVLPGFTAFSADDARIAGRRLLAQGAVRLKLARGVGGSGQEIVEDEAALDTAIDTLGEDEIHDHGVVLERNLVDATTYSIGELRIGEWRLAYHGVQHNILDPRGDEVYGGSDLHVVRGGLPDLLAQPLPPGQRRAVEHAIRYDAAVSRGWPGFFASRRNYDVVAGAGESGDECGVLEQSWRIGGATPAELAALAAFKDDPGLRRVHAICREVYSHEPVPSGAAVHYRDHDPEVGLLCKYSLVREAST